MNRLESWIQQTKAELRCEKFRAGSRYHLVFAASVYHGVMNVRVSGRKCDGPIFQASREVRVCGGETASQSCLCGREVDMHVCGVQVRRRTTNGGARKVAAAADWPLTTEIPSEVVRHCPVREMSTFHVSASVAAQT